jgi:serine protease Do
MKNKKDSGFAGRLSKRPMPYAIAIMLVVSACGFFQNAVSQTQPAQAPNGPPTVSTPVPKTTDQAAEDLKRGLPLDPARLGDPLPRNLFVELSKLINPAVVSITTSTTPRSRSRYRDPLQEFLEEFWGGRGGPNMLPRPPQPMQGLGTGFLINEEGLIVTNNHVIAQADSIKVQFDAASDKFYEAEVIGRDSLTDIALIKIDAKRPLPFVRLGASRDVQVGEWVVAFGNPYGHAHTMTKGIVSAIGRKIAELNRFPFIQTDASINPGNSGGPLVNTQGFVIGVNTAIDARAQGIGFAIPIDEVKQVIEQLEKDGRVRRGFIGVGIASVDENIAATLGMSEPRGVLITQVLRSGPADKAGIQPYDIIVEFNGKKTDNASELQNAVASTSIGSDAQAKIWRYNEQGKRRELTVKVQITENPDESRAASNKSERKYHGQKAPFDLGFSVADHDEKLARDFSIASGGPRGPIITEVNRKSAAARAGFQAGDMILEINRQPVQRATDVVKKLKKGRNLVRVARGDMVIVVTIGE